MGVICHIYFSMQDFIFEDIKTTLIKRNSSMSDILRIALDSEPGNFFVAGGALRELFCGKKLSGDIDLFVSQSAQIMLSEIIRNRGNAFYNQFGSTRWFPTVGDSFYYDIIRFDDFYHGLWKCIDILDVLNQFDITANAIAVDLNNGEFYNPVNGVRDAHQRVIKAVRFDFPEMFVSEEIKISRNSVLWFRYNHYCSKLGFDLEPVTKKWMIQNKNRIGDLDLFKKFFFNPTIAL